MRTIFDKKEDSKLYDILDSRGELKFRYIKKEEKDSLEYWVRFAFLDDSLIVSDDK